VAKDVCDVLGIAATDVALRKIPGSQKGQYPIRTLGGTQQLSIISEAGLYRLVMRSDKPEAEPFISWVTEEVLPTIRKTGGVYLSDQKAEELLADPDLIIGLAMQVKQIKLERDEAIRTKAWISDSKTASAMGTASGAVRRLKKLENQMGIGKDYMSVKAIEWLTASLQRPLADVSIDILTPPLGYRYNRRLWAVCPLRGGGCGPLPASTFLQI
jgi:prophage antirepressor-like protein